MLTPLHYSTISIRQPTAGTLRRIVGGATIVTSLACAWQIFGLMMLGIWGVPTNSLHPVALLGALALLLLGILSGITGARLASIAGLLATIPIWMVYGPIAYINLPQFYEHPELFNIIVFIPLALLVINTLLLIVSAALRGPPSGFGIVRVIYNGL